jgi:hypothetical protein
VGLIALKPEYYPILVEKAVAERVKGSLKGICFGEVERFEVPNLHALNFPLHESLDGGGTLSRPTRRARPARPLLRMEIEVDDSLARELAANTKARRHKE